MQLKENTKQKFCRITVLLLISLVILGRLTSYFYSVSATDISYANWIPTLLSYIGEILASCRTVVSFSSIAVAAYIFNRQSLNLSVIFAAAAAILDYAARFFIDLSTGALSGAEMLAVIWLLLQLAYEWIFLALGVLIIIMMKNRYASAETKRTAEKYSCIRSVRYALSLVLFSHIALEVYYLVDFMLTYTGITNTEIASMIGQFLKIIVIYGGIALILAEIMQSVFAKTLFETADISSDGE